MLKTTHRDLEVLHRYLGKVTDYINEIVQDEGLSIILACKVFMEYQKSEANVPITGEEDREKWLLLRSRNLAMDYLRSKRNETEAARSACKEK